MIDIIVRFYAISFYFGFTLLNKKLSLIPLSIMQIIPYFLAWVIFRIQNLSLVKLSQQEILSFIIRLPALHVYVFTSAYS